MMNIKFAVIWDVKLCVHYLGLQPVASIFKAENGDNSFLRDDELRLQSLEMYVFWPHKTFTENYWTIT